VPGEDRAACAAARPYCSPELLRPSHPRLPRQHDFLPGRPALMAPSGAQSRAAFAASGGEDRPACPGAHPQPEAMDLRPPTVVRLERTLAHWGSRCTSGLLRIGQNATSILHMPGDALSKALSHDRCGRRVSLLTVRGITAQVKPSGQRRAFPGCRGRLGLYLPVARATIVEHCDFPNASPPGDLGCGKSESGSRFTLSQRASRAGGNGNEAVGGTMCTHVDWPVDNERG
jgi:hypothetical protein